MKWGSSSDGGWMDGLRGKQMRGKMCFRVQSSSSDWASRTSNGWVDDGGRGVKDAWRD